MFAHLLTLALLLFVKSLFFHKVLFSSILFNRLSQNPFTYIQFSFTYCLAFLARGLRFFVFQLLQYNVSDNTILPFPRVKSYLKKISGSFSLIYFNPFLLFASSPFDSSTASFGFHQPPLSSSRSSSPLPIPTYLYIFAFFRCLIFKVPVEY